MIAASPTLDDALYKHVSCVPVTRECVCVKRADIRRSTVDGRQSTHGSLPCSLPFVALARGCSSRLITNFRVRDAFNNINIYYIQMHEADSATRPAVAGRV